ncbi:MAG: YHS domain-containing protein, partial [Bacillota bacterium]
MKHSKDPAWQRQSAHTHPGMNEHPEKHGGESKLMTDPVCGMTVDPNKAQHTAEYEGRSFVFCSSSCYERFREEPSRYVHGSASIPHDRAAPSSSPELATTGVIYTCP